jgi:hypothetical protein
MANTVPFMNSDRKREYNNRINLACSCDMDDELQIYY